MQELFELENDSGMVTSPLSELVDCQWLTNKVPGNFLFIPLTVAGTCGFSVEPQLLPLFPDLQLQALAAFL